MGIGQWASERVGIGTKNQQQCLTIYGIGDGVFFEKFRGITKKIFFYQGKFLLKRGKTQHGGRTENWNGVQSLISS